MLSSRSLNLTSLVLPLALLGLGLAPMSNQPSQEHGHREGQGHDGEHADEHGAEGLEGAMEGLQSALRRGRKLVTDPEQQEAALALAAEMQGHVLVAFQHPPAAAEGVEGKDLVAWRVGFRRQLLKLLDELLVMELAIAEGREVDAGSSYRNLTGFKKAGHEIYQLDGE